jgi:hypothetical protein
MATGSSTRRSSVSSAGAWFLLAVKLRKPSPPHWDRDCAGFQALFCRRRHQPMRRAPAKIRRGSSALAGTCAASSRRSVYFPSRFNLASNCLDSAMASRLLASLSMSSPFVAARLFSLSRHFSAASIVSAMQRTARGWGMTRSFGLQAGAQLVSQPPTPMGSRSVVLVTLSQR